MARRTCFREQYYTGTRNYICTGKIGASNHVKLCVFLNQVFLIFSGFVSSFGLALGVARDMIIPDQGKSTRAPGKSIWKSLRCDKVILHIIKMKEYSICRSFRTNLRYPKARADAQWIPHMARRTCFREQYYTGTRKYMCAGKIGVSNHVKLCIFLS